MVQLPHEESDKLRFTVRHNMCRETIKLLHVMWKEFGCFFCAHYNVDQDKLGHFEYQVYHDYHNIKYHRYLGVLQQSLH